MLFCSKVYFLPFSGIFLIGVDFLLGNIPGVDGRIFILVHIFTYPLEERVQAEKLKLYEKMLSLPKGRVKRPEGYFVTGAVGTSDPKSLC